MGESKYQLIYNWDGNPHGYSAYPQSMDEFLDKVFSPIENTQVDTLFWCVGEHQAKWASNILPVVGEHTGRIYENAHAYTFNENILAMIERGEDPHKEIIKRAKELGLSIFASVRMNDNHFGGAGINQLKSLHHSELTKFRIDNPQLLLGEKTSEWFQLSWNYEHEQVRRHKLDHVKEVCELYDWDGIELDWQRHPFHFPQGYGYRLRYLLTDFHKTIKNLANELSKTRNKDFNIAARVAPTLHISKWIGYDVETWVDEELIDLLIPAGAAHTDPSINVQDYLKLTKNSSVKVFPCLDARVDGWDFQNYVGPESPKYKDSLRTRAVAYNYLNSGVDGLYLYNWHANAESRRNLLNEIGTIDSLKDRDKMYAATHRYDPQSGEWRGAFTFDRIWGDVPVKLDKTFTGTGPEIIMTLHDRFTPNSAPNIILRLRFEEYLQGDIINIFWDGDLLQNVGVEYQIQEDAQGNPFGGQIYDWSSAVWLSTVLPKSVATAGSHKIMVVLEKRNVQVKSDILLTNVEVVVQHGVDDSDSNPKQSLSRLYDGGYDRNIMKFGF